MHPTIIWFGISITVNWWMVVRCTQNMCWSGSCFTRHQAIWCNKPNSAVISTPLQWIFKNMLQFATITQSVWLIQKIAWYIIYDKSAGSLLRMENSTIQRDQQQWHTSLHVCVHYVPHTLSQSLSLFWGWGGGRNRWNKITASRHDWLLISFFPGIFWSLTSE